MFYSGSCTRRKQLVSDSFCFPNHMCHIPCTASCEQWNSNSTVYLSRSYLKSSNHHLHAKTAAKKLMSVLMKTRDECHVSWIYTFSVTPLSVRIWALGHRERPAFPAQLCWSSGSSFPGICNTTTWNSTVIKIISPRECGSLSLYNLMQLWLRILSQALSVCFGRTPGSHWRNPEVPRNSGWKTLLYSNIRSFFFNAPLTFVSE